MNKTLLVLALGFTSLTSFARNPYDDYNHKQLARAAQELLKKNNQPQFSGVWKSENELYQAKQMLEMVDILIAAELNVDNWVALQTLAAQLQQFIDTPAFTPQK